MPIAAVFLPGAEQYRVMSAALFDPQTHPGSVCCCLDCIKKGKRTELSRVAAHKQDFVYPLLDADGKKQYYPGTREIITNTKPNLPVPEHFALRQGQRHHPDCALAKKYDRIAAAMGRIGVKAVPSGNAYGEPIHLVPWNLPVPKHAPALKSGSRASSATQQKFSRVAADAHDSPPRQREFAIRNNTVGIRSLTDLGTILDNTSFLLTTRQRVFITRGDAQTPLTDFVKEDPIDAYGLLLRKAQNLAKNGRIDKNNHTQVVAFEPASNSKGLIKAEENGTITLHSKPKNYVDKRQHPLKVGVKVDFDRESFAAFETLWNAGQRSFLIYSEQASVDLNAHKTLLTDIETNPDNYPAAFAKKARAKKGTASTPLFTEAETAVPQTHTKPAKKLDNSVFAHFKVTDKSQFVGWVPTTPEQLTLIEKPEHVLEPA